MTARLLFKLTPLVCLSFVLLGCGGSGTGGSLSGEVTLNGEPLKFGQVTAFGPGGEVLGVTSVADGRYSLSSLPPGATVTLVVQTHQNDGQIIGAGMPINPDGKMNPTTPPPEKLAAMGLKELPKPVPLKYTRPKESGLTVAVQKGNTTFDIVMTGKGEIPQDPNPPPKGPQGGTPPPPPK